MSEARTDIEQVKQLMATKRVEIATQFIKRLINPEAYGLQLSDEVRQEAYRTLCFIDDEYANIRLADK